MKKTNETAKPWKLQLSRSVRRTQAGICGCAAICWWGCGMTDVCLPAVCLKYCRAVTEQEEGSSKQHRLQNHKARMSLRGWPAAFSLCSESKHQKMKLRSAFAATNRWSDGADLLALHGHLAPYSEQYFSSALILYVCQCSAVCYALAVGMAVLYRFEIKSTWQLNASYLRNMTWC